VRQLDQEELELIADVESAGWTARPTIPNKNGFTPAALLEDNGTPSSMPRYGDLVLRIAKSAYMILSLTAHSQRHILMSTVVADGPPLADGKQRTKIPGFGMDVNLAIALTVRGVVSQVATLLEWNGASVGDLAAKGHHVLERAGVLD